MGIGDWGLGIWGLGIGDWAQSPIPNPQSPIPNPHLNIHLIFLTFNHKKFLKYMRINSYLKK
jgi:hypothetical protein